MGGLALRSGGNQVSELYVKVTRTDKDWKGVDYLKEMEGLL